MSMQTLLHIAFGRPYVDVFGAEEEEEKTESNSSNTKVQKSPECESPIKIIKVDRRHVSVVRFQTKDA